MRIRAALGYFFIVVIVVGLGLRALLAARAGDPWMGQNYWHADLGTYAVLATLALMAPIAVVWVFQRIISRFRRLTDQQRDRGR